MFIHHLRTLGNCWDGFLTRNGFATTIPIETTISCEPLIRKQFYISSNEPEYLKRNHRDNTIPSQSPHEKQDVGFGLIETPVHGLIYGHNATLKSNRKKISQSEKTKTHGSRV
jgi:hypothetical protein